MAEFSNAFSEFRFILNNFGIVIEVKLFGPHFVPVAGSSCHDSCNYGGVAAYVHKFHAADEARPSGNTILLKVSYKQHNFI